jgi:GxxExxY protein
MALSHPETNQLTQQIIHYAIDIHRDFGPGLREIVYFDSLYWDLVDAEIRVEREKRISLERRGRVFAAAFRADLVVDGRVIIEVKSVETVLPVHKAQLLTYMKLSKTPVGLLINFNVPRLVDGITRLSL